MRFLNRREIEFNYHSTDTIDFWVKEKRACILENELFTTDYFKRKGMIMVRQFSVIDMFNKN